MHPKLPLLCALAALLVLPPTAGAQVSISPGAKINVGGIGGGGWSITGTNPIEIRWGGEVITAYQTGEDLKKPFFYPVIGPTGENVTRHWPMKEGVEGEATDHLHHRGIWFGLGKVNGIDFWHEGGKKDRSGGIMVHTGLKGIQVSGKDQSITFKTATDWISGDGKLKICQDTREFRLQRRDNDEMTLDATITIEASDGDVTIEDDKEGAFAIRVLPSLRTKPVKGEATGKIINSAGQKNDDAWGKRAHWVSYYGPDKKGKPIGITFFDHPGNLRHPSWWHARNYGLFAVNPFGQGHFEKDAEDTAGDYTIKHGDSLTLKYRLFFHHGTPEDAEVEAEYKAYAAE